MASRWCTTLPGVGENLQDHLEFYFQVASKEPKSHLFSHMTPFRQALIGACSISRRMDRSRPTTSRPAASSVAHASRSSIRTFNSISCRWP